MEREQARVPQRQRLNFLWPQSNKMENSFSIGVNRPWIHHRERKRIRREKKIRDALKQAKQTKTKSKRKLTSLNLFDQQIFMIQPPSFFTSSHIAHLCSFLPLGWQKQEDFCKAWSVVPFSESVRNAEQLPCFQNLSEVFWSPTWSDQIRDELPRIHGHRWRLRRFLHRWRVSTLQQVNTEDIVTCEEPIHPITIVSWAQKQKWVFEASTLMRDITNRLQHHDSFFEQPQAPRNPLTNMTLNAAQVISVWNQLMNAPIPKSHVFTAFRASRLNLQAFRYEHKLSLQMHALRSTLSDFTHFEAHERVLDFISLAYDRQNAICDYDIYEYVVRNCPSNELVQRWRALCLRYHELELRYDSFPNHKEAQQNKLWTQTFSLLHRQQELLPLVPTNVLEEAEEQLVNALHALVTLPVVILT